MLVQVAVGVFACGSFAGECPFSFCFLCVFLSYAGISCYLIGGLPNFALELGLYGTGRCSLSLWTPPQKGGGILPRLLFPEVPRPRCLEPTVIDHRPMCICQGSHELSLSVSCSLGLACFVSSSSFSSARVVWLVVFCVVWLVLSCLVLSCYVLCFVVCSAALCCVLFLCLFACLLA